MKNLEEFKSKMEVHQRACTGKNLMGRICPERIVPEVDVFFAETMELAIECQAYKDDTLVERLAYLIESVVDVITGKNDSYVSDKKYELFQKFMTELSVVRDDVMKFYTEGNCSYDTISDRMDCMFTVINSAHKWCFYRKFSLFDDPMTAYTLVNKINTEWEGLTERFSNNVSKVFREFAKFKSMHHFLGVKYTEEEYLNLLLDVLDGRKKMSPVKVYQVVDTVSTVVDTDSDDVNFGILKPCDWFYQETQLVRIETMSTIPPACGES